MMEDRKLRIRQRQEAQRKKREALERARKEEEERQRLINYEKAQKRKAVMAAKMAEKKRQLAEALAEKKRKAAEKKEAQRQRALERKKAAAARKAAKRAEQRLKKQAKKAAEKLARAAKKKKRAAVAKVVSSVPKGASVNQAAKLVKLFHVNVRKPPKSVVTARHKEFLSRVGPLKKELEKARRAATLVQQSQRKVSYPVTDAAVPDPVPQPFLRMDLLCKLNPLYEVSSAADVGSLLRVGHFIQKFAKMLHLTPFSFLNLQKALLHSRATSLMTELHVSLLLTYLRGMSDEANAGNGAGVAALEEVPFACEGHSSIARTELRQRMVNVATWPEILRIVFCAICDEEGDEDEEDNDVRTYNCVLVFLSFFFSFFLCVSTT